MDDMKTNLNYNHRKTPQKTKPAHPSLCPSIYQRQRNYLDNSCEFIQVPLPGPVRMSHFIRQLLQSSMIYNNPAMWPTPPHKFAQSPKMTQILNNQTPKKSGSRVLAKDSLLSPEKPQQNEDLEQEVSVHDPTEKKEIDDQHYLGKVNFYNHNDSICKHNIYLKYDQKQDKAMEVTRLENNSFLVKYIQPKKPDRTPDDGIGLDSQSLAEQVVFKFFQTVKNYRRNGSLIQQLRRKIFENEELILRSSKIKLFLISFFSMEDIRNELAQLNKFELLFVAVILHKKKYQNWDHHKIDFSELQKSRSKQQHTRLLEMFVVHLLHQMAEVHAPERSLSRQRKIEMLFDDLFGKERAAYLENIKSIQERIRVIRHRRLSQKELTDPKEYSRDEHLRSFILELMGYAGFSAIVNRNYLERMVGKIFEVYKEKKITKIVDRIVDSFESKVRQGAVQMDSFLKYCVDLKGNSKFKGVWTKMEFWQGMTHFLEFAAL